MIEKLNRSRVDGFLRAKGRTIVNEKGEEIILVGWGLGNWLLSESYMWLSYKSERFDRPRHIEAVVRELCGSQYADTFWKKFRQQYITKEDIKNMAEAGYNSVRIPLNWRIFMEEEEDIIWKEDGFTLIDRCLDWCEEYNIYAFLDLHGAPGGQTGANIDDSLDNVPRLFTDSDNWYKGIKLWEKLADRYKDRWIVGGFDLLNEPIRPSMNGTDFDYLLPKLAEFYEEAVSTIRTIDKKHMLFIEGHHWATDTSIFYKKYDDNMVLHFHRYGCMPDIDSVERYIEVSQRLQVPLWLGETGENINEWYTAMFPLAFSYGIGYNIWTWKKMECTNSPCSIIRPEHWQDIICYVEGGPHPGYAAARDIFDQYLENMKIENCKLHPEVINAAFRQPVCRVRATDFEHVPGKGISYSGLRSETNLFQYRRNTGMGIIEMHKPEKKFAFDCMWDRFALELTANEFAEYAIYNVEEGTSTSLELYCEEEAEIMFMQEDKVLGMLKIKESEKRQRTTTVTLKPAKESRIRVLVKKGNIKVEVICFDKKESYPSKI